MASPANFFVRILPFLCFSKVGVFSQWSNNRGRVAQLVEHHLDMVVVVGSSPIVATITILLYNYQITTKKQLTFSYLKNSIEINQWFILFFSLSLQP